MLAAGSIKLPVRPRHLICNSLLHPRLDASYQQHRTRRTFISSASTASMLKRAVADHDRFQAAKEPAPSVPFPSSSPSAPTPRQQQTIQFKSPPALQQTSSSAINALQSRMPPANSSVKRTSSGLAKTFGPPLSDGFSESTSSSRVESFSGPASSMPVKTIQTQHEVITIDEDDFDSDPDLDLDVEDPACKGTVTYPTLPPSPFKSTKTPVSYLNIQQADMHTLAQPDIARDDPHPSSLPIPWSSSPSEHQRTPPGKPDLQSYKHQEKDTSRDADPSDSSSPVERPVKRRALPWEGRNASSEVTSNKFQSTSQASQSLSKTPASKSSATIYPWNTTASAIKNNQKELRKMNRNKFGQEDSTAVPNTTTSRKQKPTSYLLSGEQRHVSELVVDRGKSVFFTGSAGTGKSVLLREIITILRKKYAKEQDRLAVTASTGLAACNIGGVTLHSFAGIGLGKEEVPELVKKIKRNQKAKQRWMRTKVLIIDEVSMVDGELFDKLEQIARIIRNNGRPFGGIQIVITGDFFQLPPVPEGGRAARFCFDANTWATAVDFTIGLHHVFRQKDPQFANMLNEMREGRLTKPSIDAFKALSREPHYEDGLGLSTTELFPTRAEVDAANMARMKNLHGSVMRYEARDGGAIVDKVQRARILQNCMAPELLELKKGSQVMLIKNIDEGLVNGSLGTVRGFMSDGLWDDYQANPDEFEAIEAAGPEDLNPEQLKKKRSMHLLASTSQLYPLVRFKQADGCTRDLLCNRETWKIEQPNGEVQASRSQVPLILAWALSIHKAQGQTLERVKVDLGKVFERGQAYVALSRATTMEGLQVLRFDPSKVQAHEKVRSFYAGLSRAEAKMEDDE